MSLADQLIQLVATLIRECGLPRHEAWPLLEAASGRYREYWIAHGEEELDRGALALFQRWVAARQRGVPIAYLTLTREFYGRTFWVNPSTLIPRIDTELIIDTVLALLDNEKSALNLCDLGTGSGCIAITLALELTARGKAVSITASDSSTAALQVARNNAAWLGATPQMRFVEGSWYEPLANSPARFDGIVSNPPYVAQNDPHLQAGDLRFEPRTALSPEESAEPPVPGTVPGTTGNTDGLADIRTIVAGACRHLKSGGFLLIEHGHDQQDEVESLFAQGGLIRIEGLRDSTGTPRAVLGFAP